jgi:hypothetical protein
VKKLATELINYSQRLAPKAVLNPIAQKLLDVFGKHMNGGKN